MLEGRRIAMPSLDVVRAAAARTTAARTTLEKWSRASNETNSPNGGVFARFLEEVGVHWKCSPEDLARIPKSGPVVIVANHPFGFVEGATLGALLAQVR